MRCSQVSPFEILGFDRERRFRPPTADGDGDAIARACVADREPRRDGRTRVSTYTSQLPSREIFVYSCIHCLLACRARRVRGDVRACCERTRDGGARVNAMGWRRRCSRRIARGRPPSTVNMASKNNKVDVEDEDRRRARHICASSPM